MNCKFCIVRDARPGEQGGGVLGVLNPKETRQGLAFTPLMFSRLAAARKVAQRLRNHTQTDFEVTVCDQDTGRVYSPEKAAKLMNKCVAEVQQEFQDCIEAAKACAARRASRRKGEG